jgi:hypothetical protein
MLEYSRRDRRILLLPALYDHETGHQHTKDYEQRDNPSI